MIAVLALFLFRVHFFIPHKYSFQYPDNPPHNGKIDSLRVLDSFIQHQAMRIFSILNGPCLSQFSQLAQEYFSHLGS